MRVSLSWIKRLLGVSELGIGDAELQTRLALSVTEIEGQERIGPNLRGVVVGRVLTCAQHPQADRLRVTTVDVGGPAALRIVCGAPNVAVGQTVAVATIGAVLSKPGAAPGDPLTQMIIKSAKLRGEPSEGMLCAEDEIGLGPSHEGILVLSDQLVPGMPLAEALGVGDTVWVIENHAITHRPDLWGHLGWSREVAAALMLAPPPAPDLAWQEHGAGWSVELADEVCTTYYGAVVEAVRNPPSPGWMRQLLEAAGVRPVSLLVDITNYVMLEMGEPMHAFDCRQLASHRIVVRSAQDGERFTTLDGIERTLAAGDALVCDDSRPVALAGIMGGAGSMIREDTTSILLEAAIFRPDRIRRTRQRSGLSTDSSARFEKGLYPELAPAAINRALILLEQLVPGCRVSHRFHAGSGSGENRSIRFHAAQVGKLTGLAVEPPAQRQILERLGFRLHGDEVQVPWWRRKDVVQAVDVVEEIARHHGYEKIVPAVPRLPAVAPPPNALRSTEHRARRSLSAQGWDEVATYAFTSDRWVAVIGSDPSTLIRVEHPLSSEQTVLRPTLLPGLAEAIARNRKHAARVMIYEIGKRYLRNLSSRPGASGGLDDELLMVSGAYAGDGDRAPVYAARDAARTLVEDLGGDAGWQLNPEPTPPSWLVPGRTLRLTRGSDPRPLGLVGELSSALRAAVDIGDRVGYFEVSLEAVVQRYGTPKPVRFIPPSRFQRVEREFTWVCAEAVSYQQLAQATRDAAGALAAGIELVTIYRGDPIAAGEKAVSLRLALQSPDRTLDEREILQVSERVIASVGATGATLRA